METMAQAAFGLYAVIIVAGALTAAFAGSLVRGLLGLIATLFGVAGMYLLLNAAFVALMQLLIYVGAVVVLIFFAIMLAEVPANKGAQAPMRRNLWALIAAVSAGGGLVWLWLMHPAAQTVAQPTEVPLAALGKGLMEPYLLAFELISVVLLVAMSAAVLLTFEKRKAR